MKRHFMPILLTVFVCLLVTGCAMFRGKNKENANATLNAGSAPVLSGTSSNVVESAAVPTNGPSAVVTAGNGGTITTTSGQGSVTVTATSGNGLGGLGEEVGIGAGGGSSGHGPLMWVFILFGAAIVIWILWAIFHSLRAARDERHDDDYDYDDVPVREIHHHHYHNRRRRHRYYGHSSNA